MKAFLYHKRKLFNLFNVNNIAQLSGVLINHSLWMPSWEGASGEERLGLSKFWQGHNFHRGWAEIRSAIWGMRLSPALPLQRWKQRLFSNQNYTVQCPNNWITDTGHSCRCKLGWYFRAWKPGRDDGELIEVNHRTVLINWLFWLCS